MNERYFDNLTSEECKNAYGIILKNSNEKWNESILLASNKKYGSANNLLVISIEEFIKALLIFLDGKGFRFRQTKGIKRIFTDHNLRHVVAFMMCVVNIFGDDFFSFLNKVKKNPSDLVNLFQTIKNNSDHSILKNYVLNKVMLILAELEWFSNMEKMRQSGLYVDYNNTIKTPANISKSDFNDIHIRLSKVRKLIRMLIISIEKASPEALAYFEKMKKEFNDEDHYSKLSEYIATLFSAKRDGNMFSPLYLGIQNFQNDLEKE